MTIGDYIKQLFEAPQRDGSPQPPEELAKVKRRLKILGGVALAFVALVFCLKGLSISDLAHRLNYLLLAFLMFALALFLLMPDRYRRFENWMVFFCWIVVCAEAAYRAWIGIPSWEVMTWTTFFFAFGFLVPKLQKAHSRRKRKHECENQ